MIRLPVLRVRSGSICGGTFATVNDPQAAARGTFPQATNDALRIGEVYNGANGDAHEFGGHRWDLHDH